MTNGFPGDGKNPVSTPRLVIWIVVGAIGLYLVISGVVGALTK